MSFEQKPVTIRNSYVLRLRKFEFLKELKNNTQSYHLCGRFLTRSPVICEAILIYLHLKGYF